MELRALADEAANYLPALQAVRRDIHRRPELGLQTPETLERVLASIGELGLDVSRSSTISSAVVRIRGGHPGPTVVLRADLDALSLQEDTGLTETSSRAMCSSCCSPARKATAAQTPCSLRAPSTSPKPTSSGPTPCT